MIFKLRSKCKQFTTFGTSIAFCIMFVHMMFQGVWYREFFIIPFTFHWWMCGPVMNIKTSHTFAVGITSGASKTTSFPVLL